MNLPDKAQRLQIRQPNASGKALCHPDPVRRNPGTEAINTTSRGKAITATQNGKVLHLP